MPVQRHIRAHAVRSRRGREHARVVVLRTITLRVLGSRRPWTRALLDNLSVGGAGLITSLELTIGAMVEVSLDLTEGNKRGLVGRVVHVRPVATNFSTYVGVRFVNATYADVDALRSYVLEREKPSTISRPYSR